MIYFISTSSANYTPVYIRPSDNGLIVSSDELELTKKVKQLPSKTNILLQMDSGQKNCERVIRNEQGNIVFSEKIVGNSTFSTLRVLYSVELCGEKKVVDLRSY